MIVGKWATKALFIFKTNKSLWSWSSRETHYLFRSLEINKTNKILYPRFSPIKLEDFPLHICSLKHRWFRFTAWHDHCITFSWFAGVCAQKIDQEIMRWRAWWLPSCFCQRYWYPKEFERTTVTTSVESTIAVQSSFAHNPSAVQVSNVTPHNCLLVPLQKHGRLWKITFLAMAADPRSFRRMPQEMRPMKHAETLGLKKWKPCR